MLLWFRYAELYLGRYVRYDKKTFYRFGASRWYRKLFIETYPDDVIGEEAERDDENDEDDDRDDDDDSDDDDDEVDDD